MNDFTMEQTLRAWNELTRSVLSLEELSLKKVQEALTETYRILTRYHKEALVPKDISRLFLQMEEFLSFTAMMEEKEKTMGFYHWQEIHFIVSALKEGFFKGAYSYAFPQLEIVDITDRSYLINLQTDRLEQYVLLFNQGKAEE